MLKMQAPAKEAMRRHSLVAQVTMRLHLELGEPMAATAATVVLSGTALLRIHPEAMRMDQRRGQWTTGLEGAGPCTIVLREAAQQGQVEVASILQRILVLL
jgi:hypothetical protein